MYEQNLPCWQDYDPCNQYYNCPEATTTKPRQPPPKPSKPPRPITTKKTITSAKPTTTTVKTSATPNACSKPIHIPGVNNSEYYLSPTFPSLIWPQADAKATALGEGWQLATVEARAILEELERLVAAQGCGLEDRRVWVGGNCLAEPGHWVWPDGAEVEGDLWSRGQPAGGSCMWLGGDGWHAEDCMQAGQGDTAFLAQKGDCLNISVFCMSSFLGSSAPPPTPANPTTVTTAPTISTMQTATTDGGTAGTPSK